MNVGIDLFPAQPVVDGNAAGLRDFQGAVDFMGRGGVEQHDGTACGGDLERFGRTHLGRSRGRCAAVRLFRQRRRTGDRPLIPGQVPVRRRPIGNRGVAGDRRMGRRQRDRVFFRRGFFGGFGATAGGRDIDHDPRPLAVLGQDRELAPDVGAGARLDGQAAAVVARRDGDVFDFWPLNIWYFGLDSVTFASNITLALDFRHVTIFI